jgi:hypothetical protein
MFLGNGDVAHAAQSFTKGIEQSGLVGCRRMKC